MGRRHFSETEVATIRRLLQSPSRDQTLRRRLRSIGFYISDWSSTSGDFSVSDFDRLVTRGVITIERAAEAAELQVGPAPEDDRTPRV
jgi:hypothetical protein